jgi:polyisoprenoid-binding protein YceI
MSTTESTAVVDVPPAGRWAIDAGHANVGFVGRHFGLTKIRGRFTDLEGTVTIAEPVERSSVEVTINMATVDSGDTTRDDHLRSADFFDVERHAYATFRSTAFTATGRTGQMIGDLTIKDVTRPVRLDVEYLGRVTDPWGNDRIVFSAAGFINREDWGLTWNMVLEAGGWLVSKEIRLEIDVELIRQAP